MFSPRILLNFLTVVLGLSLLITILGFVTYIQKRLASAQIPDEEAPDAAANQVGDNQDVDQEVPPPSPSTESEDGFSDVDLNVVHDGNPGFSIHM